MLINNDTHQRETVSERPIWPPLSMLSGAFIISTGHYSELNERVFYPERVTIPIKNIYVTRDIEPKRRIIIPKGHFS